MSRNDGGCVVIECGVATGYVAPDLWPLRRAESNVCAMYKLGIHSRGRGLWRVGSSLAQVDNPPDQTSRTVVSFHFTSTVST